MSSVPLGSKFKKNITVLTWHMNFERVALQLDGCGVWMKSDCGVRESNERHFWVWICFSCYSSKCVLKKGNRYFCLFSSNIWLHKWVISSKQHEQSHLNCWFTAAGDKQPPRAVHPDAKRTQSRGCAHQWWRCIWGSRGSRRGARRRNGRESHELHPGHAAGEGGHWEGEEENDSATDLSTQSKVQKCWNVTNNSVDVAQILTSVYIFLTVETVDHEAQIVTCILKYCSANLQLFSL